MSTQELDLASASGILEIASVLNGTQPVFSECSRSGGVRQDAAEFNSAWNHA